MDETLRYLKAMVALQAAMLDGLDVPRKTEILLGRAGLSIQEIADALDKSYPAVAKVLSRDRAAKKGKGSRKAMPVYTED
jgi:DNA-directed RNA polymerase specialized sigma24 family protein